MSVTSATAAESTRRSSGPSRREFFWLLVRRDLKVRYAGSTLGAAWNLIHPVVMIAIYIAIFSALIPRGEGAAPYDYARHLCAGMLVWLAFAETLGRSVTALIDNRAFLQKISFPPWLLHASIFFNVLLVHGVGSIALAAILIALGVRPTAGWLAIFPLMVMAAGAASGLGLMLSAIHVFFRDAAQAIQILLQVGFWFNPIVYTKGLLAASIGEGAATWLSLNPVEHFVSLAQSAIGASTAAPAPSAVAVVLLFPAVCIGVGRIVFIRLLPEARDGL